MASEEGWKSRGFFGGVGIPAPSGPHRVGCVDVMVKMEDDELGGLLVRLYYPTGASPGVGNGRYPYADWSPSKNYLKGYLDFQKSKLSGLLSTIVSAFVSPMMPALWRAPLLEAGQQTAEAGGNPECPATFPVIVFCHGLGAMRTTYSAITCDLASHGYVVASVEHRDQSACCTLRRVPKRGGPEGEFEDDWLLHRHLKPGEDEFKLRNTQVKQRASEARRTLDLLGLLHEGADITDMMGSGYNFKQFKGRLDLSRAAIAGHSFGGATSVLALQQDSRFKCGIGLDNWMLPLYKDPQDSVNSTLSQPFYFINTFTFQFKDNVLKMMSLCAPPDASGKTPRRILTLDQTEHMHQCDVFFVSPSSLLRWMASDQSTHCDSVAAHRANMDICHAFFKRHLLRDSEYEGQVPVLDGGEGHSPIIIFGTNVDVKNIDNSEVSEDGNKEDGTLNVDEDKNKDKNSSDSDGGGSKGKETSDHVKESNDNEEAN